MYVKIDGELKSIKKIELKSDATTILIHTLADEGMEEEYKCHSDSPNYHHLRCVLSADIYIISDIICGNKVLTWHLYSSGLTINFSVLWA